MKKTFFSVMVLLISISCSNTDEGLQEKQPEVYYDVNLELADFDFDVSVETRAASTKTIYGINVYYDKEKDGVQDDFYAYGLFDTTSSMNITLIGGYKYKFVCSVVRDADDWLYYGPYSGNNFSGYAKPFQLSSSNSTAVQNKFLIGSSASGYLSGLGSGYAVIQSSNSNGYADSGRYPSLERYYGEYADYEPVPNDKVIIPVKKTFFGNKLIVNGVSGGTVSVSCKIGSDNVWTKGSITSNFEGTGSIYSYNDVYNCWKNEPNLTGTVSFTYDSNRGDWWDISKSKQITFKRNVMTTITINLTPDFSGASIGVTEESMGDDNEITLEGSNGELIEVTVDPNQE